VFLKFFKILGNLLQERILELKLEVSRQISSDNGEELRKILENLIEKRVELIITTGGTGFGSRDNTPEVVGKLIE
jgi:molybdopterin biosynthesis enzyme MoaB